MTFLRRLLRRQDGITLIMAIGVLGILTMTGTTLIYYANTNARSAAYSDQKSEAYDLAEAGINEMMAVLARPENNALHGNLLPQTTSTYPDGTVTWWGVLNDQTQTWALTSTGTIKNPTGSTASAAKRTLTASVPVTPTYTQPLNNPAWNYVFNKHTGSACDMTLANNVSGASRLYVQGNLCVSNNAGLNLDAVIVRGNLDLSNNANVGASTSMSTRVETYVGGQCRYGGGTWGNPCSGNQDARHIYSKMNPPSYVVGVNSSAPVIATPAADFTTWYSNASPGPAQNCTAQNGAVSGTTPTFDNDSVMNNSVATVQDLTPGSSYTCRVGPSNHPTGELSWNAGTKTFTVTGTIFIDGSAKFSNGALNQYNGQGTLYLSGTFLFVNGTKMCASLSGSVCNFAGWNPNTEMMTIVANGNGGQAGTGNSILVDNGAVFQGGLFATANLTYNNNAFSDGPMVGDQVIYSNNVNLDSFPTITVVPVGMPGNPQVYAQPNPPRLYSG